MASISSIALSGMNAAMTGLQSAAHNIANAGTEGFHRQQLLRTADAAGGVAAGVAQAPVAGAALERDVVDQLAAKNAFLANVAVFRTADQMAGTLLDLRG